MCDKVKNKLLILASTLIVLISLYVVLEKYMISNFNTTDFKVSYRNFKAYNKNTNYLYLYNNKGSTIKIISKENIERDDEKILLNLNDSFLKNNDKYKLVNMDKTKIGKNYLDAYEYLYEKICFCNRTKIY